VLRLVCDTAALRQFSNCQTGKPVDTLQPTGVQEIRRLAMECGAMLGAEVAGSPEDVAPVGLHVQKVADPDIGFQAVDDPPRLGFTQDRLIPTCKLPERVAHFHTMPGRPEKRFLGGWNRLEQQRLVHSSKIC
jgi:hypothetical protein